jgi:hypothetical protein
VPASLVSHARTRVSGTFVQLGMPSAPVLKNHALWIGPLVTFAGAVSYFAFFARFPALRDFPWVNLPVVLLGLGLSALGLTRAYKRTSSYRGKTLGPIGLVVSGLLSSAFVFYIFGLSFWLPEPTRVARGLRVAPAFSLVDHEGRSVRLEDYRGTKIVLTFYRGFW